MIEIDVDTSALTAAERRMLAGLTPLLDPMIYGVLRTHDAPSTSLTPSLWQLRPAANQSTTLELLGPSGALHAKITRPIVLGAVKRMMIEARQSSSQARDVSAEPVQTRAASLQRPVLPAKLQPTSSGKPTVIRNKIEPLTPIEATDPRQFVGIYDLALLLDALREGGEGIFEIRFPDAASIRVDRGSNTFRCKNFSRAQLYERMQRGQPRWSQLRQVSKAKADETQASMAPLLFVLGACTAKDRFIAGQHLELEFRITATVAYGKHGEFARIAEAFSSFSPVSDAAVKLSMAQVEILACLNAYAAIGLLESKPRQSSAIIPGNPAKPNTSTSLLSKIRNALK